MAKQCINCGAKIRFRENYFTLSNQGKYFCEKCAKTAEPLLNEIKTITSAKSYEAAKEKFNDELSKAPLLDGAKKYLRYEFDDIARMASIVPDKQYANAKTFKGSFPACRDAVYRAGKTICGSEPVVPMQCIKITTSRDGDIYVVTAVFENYFMRTGSYASLSVTMIWMPGFFSKGTAVVSAVGSGGGDGLFNISWGAEDDFVDWFWTTLQEQNPEVYAWIQIQDTNIDYPILQREGDNGYYLDHTIDGEKKTEGSIFTEDYNSKDFEDPNTVIYGHDMKNGSMFQNLLSYQDKDFFDNHKDVIIYTPDAIRHYQVFAAYLYDDRHLMQSFDFNIKSVYQAYLDSIFAIRDMSAQIDTAQQVSADDKIITLSTCYGSQSDKRFLVQAALVSIEK